MDRSEPALVPEWLRCSGSGTGGSTSVHHFASSSLRADLTSSARSRSFRSISDKDSPRSTFLDRSSSSNSARRNSNSNGAAKHPYSSFTRSHRDRNRDKEKERSVVGDLWDNDATDPLVGILTGRGDNHILRRTQSMVSRKPGEVLPRRIEDSRNGVSSGGSNLISIQKTVFEKDFPSLGIEGKQAASGIARVPSPGLSTSVQSLPIGSSPLLGGEKWTSALAEVPDIIGANGHLSAQQSAGATPVSAPSSSMAGLNMAEALSQASPRTRASPQVLDKSQRLEELAIKQSRQLIPMVPNASDKSKQLKTASRTSEVIVAAKSVQHQQACPSQLANQSRGAQVRSDASNTSHGGKFLVLKPARENGIASVKDASGQHNNPGGQVSNGQVPVVPSTPTALPSASNPKLIALENKAAALSLNSRSNLEKRSSVSQAQSRTDFFNLVRKKSLNNSSSILSDSSSVVSSPKLEKSSEIKKEVDNSPASPHASENGGHMTSNGVSNDTQRFSDVGDKNLYPNGAVYTDEEEAAFLRSLGWDENAGEDEGLTEEEINTFLQECMKLRPSLKVLRGTHLKSSLLAELQTTISGNTSSGSCSSGAGYKD